MITNRIFLITAFMTAVIFLSSVFYRDSEHKVLQQQKVDKHAEIISESLWSFNPDIAKDYLQLVCTVNKYKNLVVLFSSNREFISIDYPLDNRIDQVFESLSLIRSMPIQSEISRKGMVLGKISVEWYNTSIYTYIYEFFIILLLLTVFWFFLVTVKQKSELENRVRKRTADLKNEIEDRKLAEDTLRRSEEQMRLFFERQITGMAITSPEKGWLQVNDTLCGMLGYTRDELVRLTWEELTHPDDLAPDEVQFNRLLEGEIEGYVLDKRFLRKDESVVYTSLSVGCVRLPGGGVDYVLAALLDINERKQAEEALAESEQRLNDAQRMGSIGSWAQDIRSNKLIWSDETFRIFEIDQENPGDLVDVFFSSVHPEDREAVAKAFNDALKTKKPYEITHKLLMSDGRVKHVHEYCETEYDESGNPLKSTGTVQDITERKQGEIKLAEQLEELRRWHAALMGRENRVIEVKKEVNELLDRLGEAPRYASATEKGLGQ